MSVKATIRKPNTPTIDVETASAEQVDEFARSVGVESVTTIGTGDGAEIVQPRPAPTLGTGSSVTGTVALAPAPTRTGTSLALVSGNSGIEGEFDGSDLKTPQLKIVNGSGELSKKHNQGSLLFADELLWLPPDLRPGAKTKTLNFVPVKIKKQYRENLTQDEVAEGLMPRVVNTRAEAEEMSGEGATQWVGNKKPRWSPSAACLFLIAEPADQDRNPEDRHPGFSMPFDDKNWGLGMYYASGLAYGESAKVIMSNACTVLRENGQTCLHKRLWTLQVVKKPGANFTVFVPCMRLTRENTGPEASAFVKEFLGGNQG